MAGVLVGDFVKVVETYESVKITYEGILTEIRTSTLVIGNQSSAWAESREGCQVTVERIDPPLPKGVGAIVRGTYQPKYEEPREVVASRTASGYWFATGVSEAIDATALRDFTIIYDPPKEA